MNDWEDGARKLTGSTRKFRGQKQSLKLNSQDSWGNDIKILGESAQLGGTIVIIIKQNQFHMLLS